MYEKKLNFKQDIDVRGMRGDEALQAVTYFVDDAILVGMSRIRILHGTGTGILRSLIRQYLDTVPGVRHFADEHVQFGGAGITGKIIRSIVLVLVGVIANNYFLAIMKKSVFFSWALTALQCFLSGTALAMTPAMLIGNLLQLDPQSSVVSFLVKKLPQTKIGKAMSTAATNSIVLVFVIMIFESQYGSIGDFMSQVPALISLFAPLFIMLIGIRLMIKSVTK